MAFYCEKCRTRVVAGNQCTTCGHVNSSVVIANEPSRSTTPSSGPSIQIPLPPPAPPAKRKKAGLALGLGALLVVVVAVAVVLATRERAKPPVTVEYSIEVFTDEYCRDFYSSGYRDIPFAEVEVVDGGGKLLGTGTLDSGYDTDISCIFSASFDIRRSTDGMYRVTSGNSNRGYLNFKDNEIRNNRLLVKATLGR